MINWLSDYRAWIVTHDVTLAWAGLASLIVLIGSALTVPILIRRIPADYFLENSEGARRMRMRHPALRLTLLILKNLVGVILVVAGFIMLFTPGQGTLTLLAGILMLNFPGKRRFEVWLVRRKAVYNAINWIRRKTDQEPLMLPPAS